MSRWLRTGLVAGLLAAALAARAQGPDASRAPATGGAPSGAAPAPLTTTVKITIISVPTQKRVFVFWGKRKLGMIAPHEPLILQRPRDSGPLDLIIKCDGYIPVQTRAYTFGDSKLAVKLTPIDQKNTLLGYREEVPPPAPADAGVPMPGASPSPGVAAPPPARAPFGSPDSGVR